MIIIECICFIVNFLISLFREEKTNDFYVVFIKIFNQQTELIDYLFVIPIRPVTIFQESLSFYIS